MGALSWVESQGEEQKAFRFVLVAAIALPLLVCWRTSLHPATNLVAARPDALELDDPTTNATVLARAWARWDRGDFSSIDERVFAPIPNALALGEYYPLPALMGYPFARLTGSVPLGVNIPYYFALFSFPLALYGFLSRAVAPGWGAAAVAFLVSFGPARMNTLGVLSGIMTAFALVAASAAVDWLLTRRPLSLLLFAVAIFAQATSSLYGFALGSLWSLPAVLFLMPRYATRRLIPLAGTGLISIGLASLFLQPYFRLSEDFGTVTTVASFEQHSADLLSLLHGGIFGGPVRKVLEGLVPGFPPGAAAFFPTLTFIAVLCMLPLAGRAGEASKTPKLGRWVLLAIGCFLLSLGPTIRFAGHPLFSGIYGGVIRIPVLSSLRGIHRYDQWFDVSLGIAACAAFARLRASGRLGRPIVLALAALATLDFWPGDVATFRFPVPASSAAALRFLPFDAIVSRYPWGRPAAVRSWVDQLDHGRRVANGWLTFSPPMHDWVEARISGMSVTGSLALLRQMGVSVVVVAVAELSDSSQRELAGLTVPQPKAGIRSVTSHGSDTLVWLDPVSPILIDSSSLKELRFQGAVAEIPGPDQRVAFRLGAETRKVVVTTAVGVSSPGMLKIPTASLFPLRVRLDSAPPRGAVVRNADSGSVIGVVE